MRHIQVQLSRNIAFLARFVDKQAPLLQGSSTAQALGRDGVLAHSMGHVARGTMLLQEITALGDRVMAEQAQAQQAQQMGQAAQAGEHSQAAGGGAEGQSEYARVDSGAAPTQ